MYSGHKGIEWTENCVALGSSGRTALCLVLFAAFRSRSRDPAKPDACCFAKRASMDRKEIADRKGAADCILWKGMNPLAHCSAYTERSLVTMKKPLLKSFGDQL